MRLVRLSGDDLIISFPYDTQVLGVVKQIPGRRYEPSTKTWVVPIRFYKQALVALESLAFTWDGKLKDISTGEKQNAYKSFNCAVPLYNFQKEGVFRDYTE